MCHNWQEMQQRSSSSTKCDNVRLTKRTKSETETANHQISSCKLTRRDQMQAVDIKTVNLLTMHGRFHHKSNTKRLYASQKKGGVSLVCQCCHPL